MDFDKESKIQNFSWAGVVWQGKGAREGVCRGVGAIIFICDTLSQRNIHCTTFSSRYSIELPIKGM